MCNHQYIRIIDLQLVAKIVPDDFGHVWSTILSGCFVTDKQHQGSIWKYKDILQVYGITYLI